jgi:hypothetical protein
MLTLKVFIKRQFAISVKAKKTMSPPANWEEVWSILEEAKK